MSDVHDLVLDCDPGIDDALALFVAAAHAGRLRWRAVTCVAGNRPVDITTPNAARLLAAAGRHDVPVFRGAATRLDGREARVNLVHGADGLGGVALADGVVGAAGSAEAAGDAVEAAGDAVEALVRSFGEAPAGSLTLVAVGPLTNLAAAERRRPGLLRRARQVLVMGGAVHRGGNVTPAAEFNVWADPAAAQVVLEAGADLVLFPLDVTEKAAMSRAWIESLAEVGTRCAGLARDMLRAYSRVDPLLHDACPLVHLLAPDLFAGRSMRLRVETAEGPEEGRTAVVAAPAADAAADGEAAAGGGWPCHVMTDVDTDRLLAHVRAALGRLP